MSAKKFEKLIDLIINEDQAKAEALFHDIIVEKSRQIYESLISEDQSMGLLDEIEEEGEGMSGMMEDEDESEFETGEEIDGDFDVEGSDDEDFGEEEGEEEEFDGEEEGDLEDRVVDLEDKLDQLMAEFEAEMGGDSDEEEFDAGEEEGEEEAEEDEDGLMENVELKKVSVTHGDNGAQTKSAGLQNPKRVGTGGAPVKFAATGETVPTSPKAPSNYAAKGEGKLIGDVGNTPGKNNFSSKGEAAPKPKTETVKAKSPVAESSTAKRRI